MSTAYKLTSNGVLKKVETWKIVIPREDNEKTQIPNNVIEKTLEKISIKWGGWSNFPMEGGWFGNGKMYYDKNYDIAVDIGGLSAIENNAEKFMLDLKDELQKELSQEKIYIKREKEVEELLSLKEYFNEIGLDITEEDIEKISEPDLRTIVDNTELIFNRSAYKTISIQRNKKENKILWKREILGVQIETTFDDIYDDNCIIISPDNIGLLDIETAINKEIVVLGWNEIEGPYLTIPKKVWITNVPEGVEEKNGYYNQKGNAISRHDFLRSFADSVIIDYLILLILTPKNRKVNISVGTGGSLQFNDQFTTYIPCKDLSEKDTKVILEMVKEAVQGIRKNDIEYIRLTKAKIVNNYQKKLNALISSNFSGMHKRNIVFTKDDKVEILPISAFEKMVKEYSEK